MSHCLNLLLPMKTRLKTYIVNLPQDNERREHISRQVSDKNGLDYEFIEAVYGKSLDEEYIERNIDTDKFERRIGRKFTLPEIGCALSHKNIYRIITTDNIKVALILEDDAKLKTEFIEYILYLAEKIKNEKSPIAILLNPFLFYNIHKSKRIENPPIKLYRLKSGIMTASYIINYEGAKLLNNLSDRIYYYADDWRLFAKKGLYLYCTQPHLASLADLGSSIIDDVLAQSNGKEISTIQKIWSKLKFRIKYLYGKRFLKKTW